MREFNDKDRKKKSGRIKLPPNPSGLSEDKLAELKARVNRSLEDGYLPCPAGWKIARETGVERIAVGAAADSLGKRVTDCQIGCFKVDKTLVDTRQAVRLSPEIAGQITGLKEKDLLTCEAVFELARAHRLKPMDIAVEINAMGLKVTACQLGCF